MIINKQKSYLHNAVRTKNETKEKRLIMKKKIIIKNQGNNNKVEFFDTEKQKKMINWG